MCKSQKLFVQEYETHTGKIMHLESSWQKKPRQEQGLTKDQLAEQKRDQEEPVFDRGGAEGRLEKDIKLRNKLIAVHKKYSIWSVAKLWEQIQRIVPVFSSNILRMPGKIFHVHT